MGKCLRIIIIVVAVAYALIPYKDVTVVFCENRVRASTKYIIIHHDEIPHEITISDIDNYHRNHNQWGSGFGYNYYLKDGNVYNTKPADAPTANALNHNHDAVAICVHGDYNTEEVSVIVRIELWLLIQSLKIRYPEAELVCHCDVNSTECCGSNLINLIREWQK